MKSGQFMFIFASDLHFSVRPGEITFKGILQVRSTPLDFNNELILLKCDWCLQSRHVDHPISRSR